MISPQAEPKFAGFEVTGHESAHSSCGTISSSSEMGYCSSKSSIVSIDSSPKAGDNIKLNFAPVKVPDKKSDLAKVDDTRSSPSLVVAISSGEPVLGLKLEFDQKKRSCRRRLNDHNARRRLNDHNARRRKPQSEAISFGTSRLSAMFYDARQQKSFLFGQAPYGQMISRASTSWDNSGNGFKFAETKVPWLKPMGAVGVDGIHLSSQQVWNNITPNEHHDFDGLIPFKGTKAKVLNQGVEAPVVVSNLDEAPDLQRALSLLSNNSANAVNDLAIPQLHPGLTTLANSSNPMVQSSSAGLWQDGTAVDHHARFQAFDPSNGSAAIASPHQLHLLTPPSYDLSPSHYDQMN
ncbi:hypothetical protein PR202_gb06186 [Eleusine coracana subsp. coracana]|uniref:SBP-type domain-containing protein n=1 Tax=Eleusine coracana subsp. coracana TaxID=191504 RepID=A0AAV5E8Y3_ELECO|nr:hypothetical protein PR202_gb06186 [Eleusine coracana subsp. coracana]